MRIVLGSVVAAMLTLAGLLMAVGQVGLIARYADATPAQQVMANATSPTKMLAAREGGPAVYGWLFVQPTSSRDD
jgi:hypothetical protein